MTIDQPRYVQRAERFAIRNVDAIYASIERHDGAVPAAIPAEPLDISSGGIKLRVGAPVNFEEVINLVIGMVEGPLRLTLTCRVAWLRHEWDGSWLVGCQFIPKLPDDVLESMSARGLVERRKFPRCAVRGSARAQWQLHAERSDVELVDISQGGFCIKCRQAGHAGQRIQLNVGGDQGVVNVPANVRWSLCLDDGFLLVGCEFLDGDGYRSLSAALEGATAGSSPTSSEAVEIGEGVTPAC